MMYAFVHNTMIYTLTFLPNVLAAAYLGWSALRNAPSNPFVIIGHFLFSIRVSLDIILDHALCMHKAARFFFCERDGSIPGA